VTGLGLVTPLGPDVEATWKRLVRGERALGPLTLFDAVGLRASVAGEVGNVALPPGPPGATAGWSRTSVMAVSAAAEALEMAGVRRGGPSHTPTIGLVVGCTTGGMLETERLLASLHGGASGAPDAVGPGVREPGEALRGMLAHPLTATGDRLEERLGPFVRMRTISSACSSGANALIVGALWLLSGEVDAVLAGGSDGLCRLTLSGFNAIAALDPDACRPFDRRRKGTNLGEGAGFVVLEREDAARARGASPVAELAGWALGSEAHHITNPAPDGATVASLIERALQRAGLSPREVDYVNAHGTGTVANDRMEGAALARALGEELPRVPVSSSKGQIGHTLGAAGAIEAVITALVVARGTLVPTAGLTDPDPAIPLTHVGAVGREVPRVRAALSNSFGFGGMDTVLVFTPPGRSSPGTAGAAPPSQARAGSAVVVTGAAAFGACGRLGVEGCADLAQVRFDPEARVDPDPFLDVARARRLDFPSCLGAVVVEHALAQARASDAAAGLLLGSTFGSMDGSSAFMHRVLERGPRSASPAEFPNLVPSSWVGHVSIYAGLRGPTFTTTDLTASGESAVVQAVEFIAAGEAERLVAGATEPRGVLAGRVLAAISDEARARQARPRIDLAAAIVLEDEAAARARAAPILARVERVFEWTGGAAGVLATLRAPRRDRAEVVWARATETAARWLERTPWKACPRLACAPSLGESDALGAAAVAVAASRVGQRRIDEALVLRVTAGRGYAILLTAP
jgi:3-oxoacyl-[acyl-carrier-protein] synthase II